MDSLKNNPPAFLRSLDQLRYYHDLIDLMVEAKSPIKAQDCYAIGLMALNLALMDDCAHTLEKDGMMMTVSGDRGTVSKTNPAVGMQKEAQTALRYFFDKFQMTPVSRGNTLITPPPTGKEGAGIGSIKVKS